MKSPFPKEVYARNAEIYKLLANPKRLEILNMHARLVTMRRKGKKGIL